jgi:ADP-ribose pyrophosphatase YjhB (NUDIX family)
MYSSNIINSNTTYKKNCINCGIYGHTIKLCNSPITSYGIICYTIVNNIVKYLMVQRKDSITYIEFIRGKYSLSNVDYIEYLFQNMTVSERNVIKDNSIENLWKMLWSGPISNRLNLEFHDSKIKFEKLQNGYLFKRFKEPIIENINLNKIIDKVNIEYPNVIDLEWEIPKGRRDLNETDIDCALREFEEESGLKVNNISLCNYIKKPIEEVFLSLNKTRYRHIYYIAQHNYNNSIMLYSKKNKVQCKEIKDSRWMTYDEIMSKLRDTHIQRIELFKRVNKLILSHLACSSKLIVGSTRTVLSAPYYKY